MVGVRWRRSGRAATQAAPVQAALPAGCTLKVTLSSWLLIMPDAASFSKLTAIVSPSFCTLQQQCAGRQPGALRLPQAMQAHAPGNGLPWPFPAPR